MSMQNKSATGPLFQSLPLRRELLQVIQDLNLERATPIQEETIPLLLKGKDVIGQSKTGSGKTFAFGIPLLQKIKLEDRRPQALILCPTRELCAQVARELRKLGRLFPGFHVLILSGGQPIAPQLAALEKGAHVAVGTPGRVLDLLKRRALNLRQTSTLVLDEADRMLEMGFRDDMEQILQAAPKQRQTVLFSATFPEGIEEISEGYQQNPQKVTIEDEEEEAVIEQVFYQIDFEQKPLALRWLLQKYEPASGLIFCNLKATAAEIASALKKSGISAEAIHGDLEQFERDQVMAKFRNGSIRLLVGTDVAARGIDVADLDAVINFDLPSKPDVYVHRIGRTGRAGKSGLAIAIVTEKEGYKIDNIREYVAREIPEPTILDSDDLRQELKGKTLSLPARMRTLYLSAGRKDKLRPGDILGALTGEAGGLSGSDVGKIEIHDRYAYVGISAHLASEALQSLQSGKIKGRKVNVELLT